MPTRNCRQLNSEADRVSCFMPEYASKTVKTPLLIVEPGYDNWQLRNSWLVPAANQPPPAAWKACISRFSQCTEQQLQILNLYNWIMKNALRASGHSVYTHSCNVHGQFAAAWTWQGITVQNTTIQQVVTDFVEYGKTINIYGGLALSNPTCIHGEFYSGLESPTWRMTVSKIGHF